MSDPNPPQRSSQDSRLPPDTGNIGVGSPASDTAQPARATANSDVIPKDKRAGNDAPIPPEEEQGVRGTDRPNPPITDVREQANPSQA